MNALKNRFLGIAVASILPLCTTTAGEVVTVNNPSGSAIYQTLVDMGLNFRTVDSLKVTGTVSEADFRFLGISMNSLSWIDLSGTDITEIPEEAFQRCQQLTEIILPSTLISFGNRCFEECYSLRSITGTENVRTIGERSFAHTQIQSVPFGDAIISIGDQAFYCCGSLSGNIVFPDCFKSLSNYAFNNTSVCSVDFSNCSVNIPWYCFADCYLLENVVFPENTSFSIDGYAFWQDTLLKYIFIPEKVTNLGERAFGFDWPMTNRTVTMQSKTPISANNNSFAESYKEFLTLNVPTGTTLNYITSRGYSVFNTVNEMGYSVSIEGKGTVSIGDKKCTNGSIYFGDNVSDTKFDITPATGYDIVSISFNDSPISLTNGSYTVDSSIMTGSLKVKFAAKALNLTVLKGSGGTLKYNGASVENGAVMAVNGGESLNFSIVPDNGCFIKSITFNGTEFTTLNGEMNFNTPEIADNSTLAVEFGTAQDVSDYLMVKINQKGYGTILYKDNIIKQGSTVLVKRNERPEFTFVPGTDGYVKSVLVNSLDLVSNVIDNKLSFGSLNQDIDMQVEFYSAVDVQIDNPNGKLKSLLTEQEIVTRKIKNLKLTGNVSENDFSVISGMTNLQTVDLSETTITEIPSETFRSKSALTSIAFPLSLISIRDQAFYECRNLKTVTGYENIRYLYYNAFAYCESLEILPFGDKIEHISDYVFEDCNNIPKDIVLPPSLKSMNNRPFGYSNLNSIDMSQCVFEGGFSWHAFEQFKYVILPENGNYSIGSNSFSGSKIISLIIPEAVKSIYDRIFEDVNSLRDVYMRSAVPPTTNSDPFGGNYTTMTLHVPAGSAEDYLNTPFWGDFGKIVEYGIGLQSDSRGVVYVNGKRQSNESAIFPDGNNDLILSLVPNSGYELDQVLFNGTPLEAQANGTFIIAAGIDEGALAVKWKAKKYDITVNYSGNGFILCGGQTIANGGVVTVDTASVVQFEMAPTSGNLVKNISFNGIESVVQNGGKVYVTPAISGASTLDVAFAESSGIDGVYTFSISTGINGTIVYKHTTLLQETSINIAAGDKAVFEINPKNNYEITKVTYNDTDVTQNVVNGQYVINSVNEAASIKVSFGVKKDVVIPLSVAGTLGTVMFDELKEEVEKLAVAGPMNESDFAVIREEMPHLKYLNLSGADFSYINSYAFNSDSTERSFIRIELPSTLNYLYGRSFGGCKIDTLVLISNDAFDGSWDAFDDYAKYNTIVRVPVGTEDRYVQYNPWNYFKNLTDGIVNRNNETFMVDNNLYIVTDIDNNSVKAVVDRISQYAEVPANVTLNNVSFTVVGARFTNTDSDGNRYILTNRDFGPWKGKYLYSSEYRIDRWVGAPDDNWTKPDYDDSNWTSFDGPLSTDGEYTQWKGNNNCYWVRRTFQLDEIDFKTLRLYYDIWEPMEVYINGIKVREGSSWCDDEIPSSYFRVGTNVIATRLEHGDGYERIDFSLRQTNYMIDGLIYSVTNFTRKEMQLIGARADITEMTVPSMVSFLGTTYTVTSIAEGAFRGEGATRKFASVKLPSIVKNLGCEAFYNCLIDTLIVENTTAFDGCWYAFDNNCKQHTVLCVPAGMEEEYRQHGPWNEFKYITDGVVNRNNDVFYVDNTKYIVTDIDNKQVQAYINSVPEYDLLPSEVQVDGMTFTIASVNFAKMDSNGNIMIVSNGSNGSWIGKYWYSSERIGDTWLGDTWTGGPASNWMNMNYDDSKWIDFDGPIMTPGYGGYTDWKGEYDCYWVRRIIELSSEDIVDASALYLNISMDDEILLYINGTEVYRGSSNTFDIPVSLLKVGKNIIAAQGVNHGGPGYMDFSVYKSGFTVGDFSYRITNNDSKEVSLIGINASKTDINIPQTISFVGTTYTVSSISESAFRSDDAVRSITNLTLPSTVTYLECDAFRGCQIDTIVLTSSSAFGGCWSAFDENTRKNTVLVVPVGMEDQYRQHDPWNYFVNVTDGVVNRNNDVFYVDNIKYVVTDIDNKQVQAYINSVPEYDLLPSEVQADGMTFTIASVNYTKMDSNGNIMIVSNGSNGPWNGKYWYSSERIGDTWLGDTWTGGPASNWMNMDYDDSKWVDFNGPITSSDYAGYTYWNGEYDCYWVRRIIELSAKDLDESVLKISVLMDDEILLYINGVEVYSGISNTFDIPASLLKVGKNIIAAQGVNSGGGPGHIDFSIYKSGFTVGDFSYRITNNDSKEVSLIGINTSKTDINIPQTISFVGTTYTVSSISESAFRSDDVVRSITKLTLPSTVNYLECNAFRGCQIDTIVLTSSSAFGGCWSAFDNDAKSQTVVFVPVGSEDDYCQFNPWNEFQWLTDGVINRNNESFVADNMNFIVTDIDNNKVQAVVSSISQYNLVPQSVTVNDMTFTVAGATFNDVDNNGNRYLLTNRDFGPWKGKYLYSSVYKDSTWVGAPNDNWTKPDYDDSNWTSFSGPISTYGEYTQWKGDNDCYWVRRTFQLDNIDFKSLRLWFDSWETMTVYINGVKYKESSYCDEYVPASYFKVGTNVIAMSLERRGGSAKIDISLQQTEYAIDGLLYSITDNIRKEVALRGVLTGNKEITVPPTISILGTTYRVTSISTLDSNNEITKVLGMQNVERIENWSFANCSSLNEVTIPGGLKYIGAYAFYNCLKLNQDIVIPASVTIEEWAFHYSGIKSVTINSASVGNYAFNNCSSLEKVVLNEGVVRIGYESFRDCRNLKKVILNNGLTSIGENAFCYSAIDSLTIPSSVITIGNSAFSECRNLVYVQLPENLTTIESHAFYGCRGIAELTIPASVTSIGVNALYGIGFVRMESSNPPVLNSKDQFEEITAILLPNGAYDAYCNAAYWTNYQKQFTTADNMEVVAEVTQNPNGSNLEQVLGEENLPYIVGLKVIGTINSYDIFMIRNKMTLLRKLDLSEATIVANDYEYYEGCHTEDNVIGPHSFSENNISTIILPSNATRIGTSAFEACRYLTQIIIPDAVEYIDWSAFANCDMLRYVYIGNGVKSIEGNAFWDCNNLRELHLGKNVSAIGSWAFYSCDNLSLIEFGPKLQFISEYAFSDCWNLTDIILPSSLIQISHSAFRNCTSLREVKIPSSVKYIQDYAFFDCPLEKVYTYTIEPTKISQHTFSTSAYKTSRLYIPSTSKYNYYYDTQWGQFTGGFVNFDEPYEFFYLNGDYALDDNTGRIDGTPDMEMNQTSGITVEGDEVQEISAIELNFDYSNENETQGNDAGPSIIAGSGDTNDGVANLTAKSMDVNIGVDGNRWYFFCFPFDLDVDSVECTSDYVFYSYDGIKRSRGLSGWTKLDADVKILVKGNGYIFQSSRTGVLTIHVGTDYLQFKGKSESEILHSYESQDAANASWNFLGNPFISYYDIKDLSREYDAPIVIWNGSGYEVYKPGDDDYQLRPFEAYFVQKTGGKSAIEFLPEYRITYNESQVRNSMYASRRAALGTPISLDRQLVNITIMDSDSVTDKTRIVYSTKAAMDYEIGVDAAKFQADGVPQIYTLNGATKYAINERPMGTDDIKLGYTAPKSGTYTLSIPRKDAEVEIYDNVTKSKVDFTFGDYTFETKAGSFNDRFVIHKTSGGVTAIENGFRLDGMTVTAVNGGIEVEGRVTGKVSVYSESGMLLDEITRAGRIELVDGVYIIKIGDKSVKMNVVL